MMASLGCGLAILSLATRKPEAVLIVTCTNEDFFKGGDVSNIHLSDIIKNQTLRIYFFRACLRCVKILTGRIRL